MVDRRPPERLRLIRAGEATTRSELVRATGCVCLALEQLLAPDTIDALLEESSGEATA